MSTTLLLVQILNGLQLGILLFLVAAGLTLVFGVMSFLNLAHGVQYMLGAYLAVTLYRATGSVLVSIALTLPASLLCGLLLERLVLRHLYQRNPLEQVLATFGIILFLNESVRMVWGAAPLDMPVPDILSGSIPLMEGLRYPVYRLAIMAAGLIVALALYLGITSTRAGMLVRAGAANAPMVSALGVDIKRLFMLVLGCGAMLAGFAGAMVAPILSVEPGMGDQILILAFVVIVIGGIGSIRGAFVAAILVGVIDTLGRSFATDLLRLFLGPSTARMIGPALASMSIYLLMAAVLAVRPAGLFAAQGGHRKGRALRAAVNAVARILRSLTFDQRMAAGLFALMALLPLLAALLGRGYLVHLGERALILAIAAVSLELLVGVGGLVSFGHAAFLGIGAYAAGIAASHGAGTLWVALPAALGASALFALLTGAIAVRTHGVYFIMITLAFGQMAFFVATSLAPYGGDDGLGWPGRTLVLGSAILKNDTVFLYVTLAIAIAAYVLVSRLIGSRFGRVLRGLTDSEARLEAIGFAPYPYRLTAYVIAGTLCGLAGLLLGNHAEFVSPAYMHWQRSGELIVIVLLGGTGTVYGPILGAIALVALEETLAGLTEHWKALLGPLLVLVVLFAKGGLAGGIEQWRRRRTSLREMLGALAAQAAQLGLYVAGGSAAAAGRWGELRDRIVPAIRHRWEAMVQVAARVFVRLARGGRSLALVLRWGLRRLALLVKIAFANARTHWHPWKMALGHRLVAIVLRAERGIADAAARWRQR